MPGAGRFEGAALINGLRLHALRDAAERGWSLVAGRSGPPNPMFVPLWPILSHRVLPLLTSTKFSDILIPSPACPQTDLWYKIHATSLTTSAFP